MIFNAEGLVLKGIDYGESHKIVHILSPSLGKFSAIALGAKKTKSKFSATTQPLMLGSFVLFRKGDSLASLNQSEIIQSYPKLRNDLLLSTYAMYILDVTERVQEENEPAFELFQMLTSILNKMEEGYDAEILVRIFEIKLFALKGYRPCVDQCLHCNAVEEGYAYRFSVRLGGFLCPRCTQQDPKAMHITPSVAKLVRVFLYIDLERIGEISVKKDTRAGLEEVSQAFIREHLGLQMKGHTMIAQIKSVYES
ncbi:DNA repair protein RecO [Desulfuribacillus stibiiarsenatis]|uniref:DNA repair protein RecO n=1 Tax=Desulfuribacillus stibiiarsenatis TaxID=1390249 RepID=A0A1E5L7M3_9FIRM|nr:DNA repair protein RecO [Desulfuribacillus stibiiarsenatis]OEH86162.1 DNA repair protein RecO [Desulfuribacillus stibiiarsenatis]